MFGMKSKKQDKEPIEPTELPEGYVFSGDTMNDPYAQLYMKIKAQEKQAQRLKEAQEQAQRDQARVEAKRKARRDLIRQGSAYTDEFLKLVKITQSIEANTSLIESAGTHEDYKAQLKTYNLKAGLELRQIFGSLVDAHLKGWPISEE